MKAIFAFLLLGLTTLVAEPLIIPKPQQMQYNPNGEFVLKNGATWSAPRAFGNEIMYLTQTLQKNAGIKLRRGKRNADIVIQPVKAEELGDEGYRLLITPKQIQIQARRPAGAFYAIQTILQMMPAEIVKPAGLNGPIKLPLVKIQDKPRFSWRALLLDEGRYFKGKEAVLSILDQMAALKMNIFHWHLTEDQGWRIEIKKYPKLTEIGSKRRDSQIGGWNSEARSGVPHEGFYTQKEIIEIVRYAMQRHITIVPEIGMPGHAQAAIASYPILGTDPDPNVEVSTIFGKMPEVYNPAKESTYQILSDILDEVCRLFPGPVIHTGGDEVRFDKWKASKEVQAMMKEKNLKTMADVQIYFTNRMSKIIEEKGRRMMGWNEIMGDDLHGFLQGGQTADAATLSKTAIVQFWKGGKDLALKAIRKGHDVVNSYHSSTYLDYGHGLDVAYAFDPIFEGLEPEFHDKVLGFGTQMWGEWIPTRDNMEHRIYPRLAAYGEIGWTELENKNYDDFIKRVQTYRKRWDLLGIKYNGGQIK